MNNLYLIIIAFVLGVLIYNILPKFCGCDRVLEGHGTHDRDENADIIFHILNSIDYRENGDYNENNVPQNWEQIWNSGCVPNGNKIYNRVNPDTCSDVESYNIEVEGSADENHLQRLIIRLIHHIESEIISDEHKYSLIPFLTAPQGGSFSDDIIPNLIKLAKVANILIDFHSRVHSADNTHTGNMHSFLSSRTNRETLLNYYNSNFTPGEIDVINNILVDPCEGVNCGEHGSCSGGTCQCESGYRGDRCEIQCIGQSGPYMSVDGPIEFQAMVNFRPDGTPCSSVPSARCQEHVLDLPFTLVQDTSAGTPECPATLSCDMDGQRYTDTPEFAGLCNAFRNAHGLHQNDKIRRVGGQGDYGGYLLPGIMTGSPHNGLGEGNLGGYPYSSSTICNSGTWLPTTPGTEEDSEGGGIDSRGCWQTHNCNHWRPQHTYTMESRLNEIPRLIKQHCAGSCFCPTNQDGLEVTRSGR